MRWSRLACLILPFTLPACDLVAPESTSRVTVTMESCCPFTEDSVFVSRVFTTMVLARGLEELDSDQDFVEVEVPDEQCDELTLMVYDLVDAGGAFIWAFKRGQLLHSVRLGSCGDFVAHVNWAEGRWTLRAAS